CRTAAWRSPASSHLRSVRPVWSATTPTLRSATSRSCTVSPLDETSGRSWIPKAPLEKAKARRSSKLCTTTHPKAKAS
ncbi:MAG: hypothetical protein AVDCRST_MAG58-2001, partial [uncultured Rubrobacteraceae bacterium]